MSVERVNYSSRPAAVRIEHRAGGKISDIWIRQNITPPQPLPDEQGNTGWLADEAYMQVDSADCPDVADVESDIEDWFAYASEWKPDLPASDAVRMARLRADVDYIAVMTGVELEA